VSYFPIRDTPGEGGTGRKKELGELRGGKGFQGEGSFYLGQKKKGKKNEEVCPSGPFRIREGKRGREPEKKRPPFAKGRNIFSKRTTEAWGERKGRMGQEKMMFPMYGPKRSPGEEKRG